MEVFKDITGYEGYYEISNYGRVKSVKFNRILKGGIDGNGYPNVGISKNGKTTTFNVHKLMGLVFFGVNTDHFTVVHHKDNIKTNNSLDNLEIVSKRKNTYTHHKGTSKYRGVSKRGSKWEARIYYNGKDNGLGLFNTEKEAHLAYQKELTSINKNKSKL